MSFSNNCNPDKMPGTIKGNPLIGLCEKTCVQVNKVFDACIKQEAMDNIIINVTNITPASLTPPFKFISAKSVGVAATIDNLVVTDLADNEHCSRVCGDVMVPIQVVLMDCNGNQGVGTAQICVHKDVVLHTPTPSLMPYTIEAIASLVAPDGKYLRKDAFAISACVTVLLKVLMPVEILVPSYGYASIPSCQEYTEEVCEGVFDLPLYPNECNACK